MTTQTEINLPFIYVAAYIYLKTSENGKKKKKYVKNWRIYATKTISFR